jgi:hypothetical protein
MKLLRRPRRIELHIYIYIYGYNSTEVLVQIMMKRGFVYIMNVPYHGRLRSLV